MCSVESTMIPTIVHVSRTQNHLARPRTVEAAISGPCRKETVPGHFLKHRPNVSSICARSSVSSYRAEASFFKALAGSPSLSGVAPRCFWVHIDDRRDGAKRLATGAGSVSGCAPSRKFGEDMGAKQGEEAESSPAAQGTAKGEGEEMGALRASSFMIVTGMSKAFHAEPTREHLQDTARACSVW